ncbi:MAG: AraC family transcriptional regulator [Tateyamaria sp.]|nr:AraC family transcriptional regulator [Tateyamaria sp.]MDG1421559.1 AraC family transcriptional regulator [Tateyamaria sp.]
MDQRLGLVRAAYLNDFVTILRDVGVPVDRFLAQSSLPQNIEELPQMQISTPTAVDWLAKVGNDINPMELGLLASVYATSSSLLPVLQTVLTSAHSGIKRLEALIGLMLYEDRTLKIRIRKKADSYCVDIQSPLKNHRYNCFQEWLCFQAIIPIIRSVTNPEWCPKELSFTSHIRPPEAIYTAYPNTRIFCAQPITSITIPTFDLMKTYGKVGASALNPHTLPQATNLYQEAAAWELPSYLRTLVKPYLTDGPIKIDTVAEITGISTRTLQRNLKENGSSYSQIIQEARFELACSHLNNQDMKVIDVAIALGYENPQHFSRAFRRISGITPSEYRTQIL